MIAKVCHFDSYKYFFINLSLSCLTFNALCEKFCQLLIEQNYHDRKKN